MEKQERYEYLVFLQITDKYTGVELPATRMDIERFRIGLSEAFGDRFKWLKHGSIYTDYIALVANVDGLGEEERQCMKDAKLINDQIIDKLGHLGWKNTGYSIQPKRKEGNLWFTFSKESVKNINNQI